MEIRGHFIEAFANLGSAKLRTFLAILGVLVGTASVVAMVSGGELATRAALAQFKSLGTNLLAIQINVTEGSDVTDKLPIKTVDGIAKVAPGVELVSPYSNIYLPITYAGQNIEGEIVGVTDTLGSIMKLRVFHGRFISFLDTYEPFCVIGQGVYQSIKAITLKNPIGQQINIGNNIFTIIGILQQTNDNGFIYADINNSVMLPLQTALSLNKYADINNIVVRLNPKANIDNVQNKITQYFSEASPSRQLYFQSAKQLIESMRKQQDILTIFLGFIGSIALLVGGIGVMNIMLVSVTERKREIGIRLAIGARKRDIELMFLIEAVMLSFFGGFIGVLLGVLVSFIIAEVKGWAFSLFLMPPLIGFGVSVLTGVFFGFYPAYKASKLDPIQTLRAE